MEKDLDLESARRLFQNAIGSVQPVKQDKILFTKPKPKLGLIKQRIAQKLKFEAQMPLEKDFSKATTATVEGEAALWFARPGVQEKQLRQLRKGSLSIEATCDLHGSTQQIAAALLEDFIQASLQAGHRTVCIIHGKGNRSGAQGAVLKNVVNQELSRLKAVLAFCSATRDQGGAGAVFVLLKTLAS